MSGTKVMGFSGMAPKVTPKMLPTEMAQTATNTKFDTGRLEGIKENSSASLTFINGHSVSSSTKTLFKYANNQWVGSNTAIDILRSPIAEDPHDRIYISGQTTYPQITSAQSIGSGTYYRLGVTAPPQFNAAPTMSPSTSANVDTEEPVSISYVYTYVTSYGEEGPPNEALVAHVLDKRSDQTVTVNFPTVSAPNSSIAFKRVYRTDTSGVFRRVGESATASFVDNVPEVALGEAIPTETHVAPPDETSSDHPDGPLLGLVSLPNGIIAGFAGQTVCFSEPFLPHAFPKGSRLTVKSPIVGLVPMTNGLLVLTKEKPAMITGLDPRSMSMSEVDSTLSCVHKRSIVDMGQFSIYASPDGLVMATENGLQLITEQIFTRDQWQDLSPESIVGFQYEGQYLGFYVAGSESKGFVFDPRGGKNAYTQLDFHATAGFNDLENDELYLVVGGTVVKYQGGSRSQEYVWKSKKFYTTSPINVGVGKVELETDTGLVNYAVTVVNSGGNKFVIGGETAPVLNLVKGRTYVFDQSNSSNANHPLRFSTTAGAAYVTGVTVTGTPGSSGANVTFVVASDAPDSLKYYCSVHGNSMGNTISLGGYVDLKLYADGVLKHTEQVYNSEIFRLPSGYKAREFEFELTGSEPVNSVCLYETAREVDG